MKAPNKTPLTRVKYFIDYQAETRECRDCREIKPFKEFRLNDTGKYPQSWCKACKNVYIREYNRAKKPEFRSWDRK